MITNIIDRRKRPYRFKKINAVIEPTHHDNAVKDGDKAKERLTWQWLGYAEKEHISVSEAVEWAEQNQDLVTLYLYDKDDGIYVKRKK